MLKKKITYTDYDGNQRTEDFYFNLTKAELTEMNYSEAGGLNYYMEQIVKTRDTKKMLNLFREIIKKSYGTKSIDGRRFVKNDEQTEEFMQTEAYSNLFMELYSDADKLSDFLKGIIPSDMRAEIDNEDYKKQAAQVITDNGIPLTVLE
jgi:hypothetical protein